MNSVCHLPPEIWNSTVYFTQDNNLIKFLIYCQTMYSTNISWVGSLVAHPW